MARRKSEAAMEKRQRDAETVKAEEHPPEEPTGETEAEKAEKSSLEEKLAEESEVEKTGEHPPEEKPTGESEAEKAEEQLQEEKRQEDSEPDLCRHLAGYKIVCRNKITKRIGGVDFMDGEGYTLDGYAASWFAAKDGYTVESAELGQLW